MKDWIKKLDDSDISTLFDEYKSLENVPENFDKDIYKFIDKVSQKEVKLGFLSNLFSFPKFIIPVTALASFLIIGLISFYNYTNYSRKQDKQISSVRQTQKGAYIIKKGRKSELILDDKISSGDVIKTDVSAECRIKLYDKAIVKINENSKINFVKIEDKDKINLALDYGVVLVNVSKLKNNEEFKIITDFAQINVVGTKFAIENKNNKYTQVFVTEGIVKVKPKYKTKHKFYSINAGKKLFISKEKILEGKLTIEDNEKLAEINNLEIEEDDSSKNTLRQNLKEKINNTKEHIKEKKREWKIITTYQMENGNDTKKDKILGFTSVKDYIIAQTETSILCFDPAGTLKWQSNYGDKTGLFFMSLPVIFKNRIYLSSINKKMLVIDLKSGNEKKAIFTSGSICFGNQPVINNEILYLPFADGIYIFDLIKNSLYSKPIISSYNPTTPVFKNNMIYFSSMVDKNISCYDKDSSVWTISLQDRTFSSPVIIKNYVFISDKKGNIYKISMDGKIINQTNINSGITSALISAQNNLFVLADNGYLYEINLDDLKFNKLIKIDNNFEESIYLYKKIVLINNKLLIGNDSGKVIIYNIEDRNIENLDLDNNSINSTVYYDNYNNIYLCSSKSKKIFFFNHQ